MTDYKKLRELAQNATPGPWVAKEEIDGVYAGKNTVVWTDAELEGPWPSRRIVTVGQTRSHHRNAEANVAYIAALTPEVILELIEKAEIYDDLCES